MTVSAQLAERAAPLAIRLALRGIMRAPETCTPNEAARWATFFAATKGKTAYSVACALRHVKWGIDYRGCGKRLMAEEFARGHLKSISGSKLREALK